MITLNNFLDIGYKTKMNAACFMGVRVPSGYDHYALTHVVFGVDIFDYIIVTALEFKYNTQSFKVYTYSGINLYNYSFNTPDGSNLITVVPDYFVITFLTKMFSNYDKFITTRVNDFINRFGNHVPLWVLSQFNTMYNSAL